MTVWVGDEGVFAVDNHGKNLAAAAVERLDLGDTFVEVHLSPVERGEFFSVFRLVSRLEAGVIGWNGPSVASALDVVLAAHGVEAGALAANVAGQQGEIAQALDVVNAADVLGDAEGVIDAGFVAGTVPTGGLFNVCGGYLGDGRSPLGRELDDVL